MKNKIPCIKCTKNLWNYIKQYLKDWGYNIIRVDKDWNTCPFLVINSCGLFGICENFRTICISERELINNVDKFLEKAAKLKGFTYIRKDIMEINGIKVKPGMVITTSNSIDYIAFPTKMGISFTNNTKGGWTDKQPKDIICIRDLAKDNWITSGKILWEKPKKVVITKKEIAEKFGYDVTNIEITE